MKLFTPKFERDPRWQRDDWRSHHLEEAQVYLGVLALRDMIAEVTKEAVSRLAIVQGTPGDDSITGLKKEVRFKLVSIGAELAACETLLRAAENDPRFALAEREFQPLLAASAERDASEERVRISRQEAEAALTQARESALKRAIEEAESHPSIVKATAALAEADAAVNEL
jgi:hypothetical protein